MTTLRDSSCYIVPNIKKGIVMVTRNDFLQTEHKTDNYDPINTSTPSVKMANALTRATHNLTLAEKRLIMVAASKFDSKKVQHVGANVVTTIAAHEYAELAEVSRQASYMALKTACKHLFERKIQFQETTKFRNGKPVTVQKQMRWVGGAEYNEKEGTVTLKWWHEVLPYMTGLGRDFTKYYLKQTTALRSIYSWRLLELLSQFRSTGEAFFDIKTFTKAMEATPKQQENFAKIRSKIIEPAIKELQEKDGWKIEYFPKKTGRKISHIVFRFERDTQNKLFDENE